MVSFVIAQSTSSAATSGAFAPILVGSVVAVVTLSVGIATLVMRFYRKCSPNQMMVIYGRLGSGKSSRCIAGGGALVIPVLQDYAYIDLTPRAIEAAGNQLKTRDGQWADLLATSVVAVSTKPDLMPRAAERLLGLSEREMIDLLQTMLRESVRKAVAQSTLEEIQREADSFDQRARSTLKSDLAAIGVQILELSVVVRSDPTAKSGTP